MAKFFNFVVKVAMWTGVAAVGGYFVQRKQLDEKVLMGFEKYFRALIGQEPLA